MCLATPMKIIKITGNKATVGSNRHFHEISLDLVKGAKIGDYVLAHGDMAINKLPKEEAEKILGFLDKANITN